MKKRKFPATMKATSVDFDAIHGNTELGIGDLVRALGNANTNPDRLVFNNDDVTFIGTGDWTVQLPDLYYALDGVIGYRPASDVNVTLAGGDRTVAIFLRIERSSVNGTRDFLDLSSGTPSTGSADFVLEEDWTTVNLIVVDNYTGPGDDPVAAGNDVGDPLKLCHAVISGGVLTIAQDPDNHRWVFPAGTPPAVHADEHLTAGSDPIQLANAGQEGLMSAAAMQTVLASLTNVTINASSPFVVRTITGDNAGGGPKSVEFLLRVLPASFRTIDQGGGSFDLGLNFPIGGNSGASEQPARSDHKHDLSDSPVQVATRTIVIDEPATQLGSLIQVQAPLTFGLITHVTVYWLAPTITAPFYPLVEARWSTLVEQGISRKVGARYTLAGNRDLRIRIGDRALCELLPEELTLVTAVTGSQTWDSVGGSSGLLPTTGTLVVTMTGVRLGVSIPQ